MPCGRFHRRVVGVGRVDDSGDVAGAFAGSRKAETFEASEIAVSAYNIKAAAVLRNAELVGRKNFALNVVVKSAFFDRIAQRMVNPIPGSSLVVAF